MNRSCQVLILLICACTCRCATAAGQTARQVVIIQGSQATEIDRTILDLLSERLQDRSQIAVEISDQLSAPEDGLCIYIGQAAHHPSLTELCDQYQISLPTNKDPGPEGFVLKSVVADAGGGQLVIAVGTDQRGVLYAVGEILRRIIFIETTWKSVPTGTSVRLRHSKCEEPKSVRGIPC
jgi:hypothetical protein